MGIFRRKEKITSIGNEKTPVTFKSRRGEPKTLEARRRKRRKMKRVVSLVLLVMILGVGGYFGTKAYFAIKKIFAQDNGILSLWGGDQGTALRGESSGRTNILILGVGDEGHDGATLSDTMIIGSLDTKDKNVAMFSIPRDLYVQIPKYGYAKINSAHAYGEQYKYPGGGMALARETVEKTFDITIHYTVRVDFSGLAKTVDTLGGVTVDVENEFCDYDYPTERSGDTSTVCFEKGQQQMNGLKALQFSRSRHALGVEGSDFARSKRQQKVLVAIKEKALSANTVFNPTKVLDLISVLGDHVKADPSFQVGELARAYDLSKQIDSSKIINRNFDNSANGLLVSDSGAAGYILEPRSGNFKEIQEVIKNIFKVAKARNEKASIALFNGTWNYNLAERVGEDLKDEGFNVVSTGDADAKNYTKTVIIDYSDGKKTETIKYLEAKFDVIAQKQTPNSTTFDIKVIIGRDYKE